MHLSFILITIYFSEWINELTLEHLLYTALLCSWFTSSIPILQIRKKTITTKQSLRELNCDVLIAYRSSGHISDALQNLFDCKI